MTGEHASAAGRRPATRPLPPALTQRANGRPGAGGSAGELLSPFVARRRRSAQRTGPAAMVPPAVIEPALDAGVVAEEVPEHYEERYDEASATPMPAEPDMTGERAAAPDIAADDYAPFLEESPADSAAFDVASGNVPSAAGEVRGAHDPVERIAGMLEVLADEMRSDARAALERRVGGRDRLEALIAAVIAGYLAAGTRE